MLKIENTEVLGWEHAIRGMRNPMNSWAKVIARYLYASANAGHMILKSRLLALVPTTST